MIGGFSMGAVMSYSVALGPGRPVPADCSRSAGSSRRSRAGSRARGARALGLHPPRRQRPDHLGRVRAAGRGSYWRAGPQPRLPRDKRRALAAAGGARPGEGAWWPPRPRVAARVRAQGVRSRCRGSRDSPYAGEERRSRGLVGGRATCVRACGTNLEKGAEAQGSLPGFGEPVTRTFDAPEALGIRFHEVQARSAINGVPERSRMPFRWTINPFRGCTHACVYCFARPPTPT